MRGMLLVIFGAGASYDSVPHLPPPTLGHSEPHIREERPPLANQLFEDRPLFVRAMERFPACIPLIPSLRGQGVMVENRLSEIRSQAATFPERHRQLAAIRFYLRLALWECQDKWHEIHRGITNYSALLDEIERWRYQAGEQVCFVTFNYDTMLERAMQSVLQITFPEMTAYLSQKSYSLIKLHGSINWGREVEGIASSHSYNEQRLVSDAVEITPKVGNKYRVFNNPRAVHDGSVLLFPALSIPVAKKDEFSCPSDHVNALKLMLPNVDKVITIGWRATEADFLTLLKGYLTDRTELMIVSGGMDGVRETLDNVHQYIRPSRVALGGDAGFTALIVEQLPLLEAFLR